MESRPTNKNLIIAIDGWSSCGKSTLAKALAYRLNYIYIDSGAMYRGVTVYFQENKVDINSDEALRSALSNISLEFRLVDGINTLFLNGANIEDAIRMPSVSADVSKVAALPLVRDFLQSKQREYGANRRIIMDGRDIGTVIFPNADLKIFVTASVEVRTERRYQELKNKGIDISRDAVEENLKMRDHIDSTRDHSPLRQANDATVLDNSTMTREEQLEWLEAKVATF